MGPFMFMDSPPESEPDMDNKYTPEFFMELFRLSKAPIHIWKYTEFLVKRSRLSTKSGTYGFYSTKSNKVYVGSGKCIERRMSGHLSIPSRSNRHFQNALKMYGKDTFLYFVFDIITDKPSTNEELKTQLIELEDYLLQTIPSHLLYNVLKKAYTSVGFKHTPDTIEVMRNKKLGSVTSEATKQKLSERFKGELNPFYGKTHTEESRRLISEARMGTKNPMYGKPKSPEFLYDQNKDKAGVNNPKAKAVTLTNIHTKETFSFGTVVEAASFVKGHPQSLGRACNQGTIYKGTWLIQPQTTVQNDSRPTTKVFRFR